MLANNIAFHNIEATGAAAISVYNKSNEYMNTARFSIDRIYEQCFNLISIKRKLLQHYEFPRMGIEPVVSQEKKVCSIKIYVCLHKILLQMHKAVTGLVQQNKVADDCQYIKKILEKLKNDKQLLTQEQQLHNEAAQLMTAWQRCSDPFLYYDIDERRHLKDNLKRILKQISQTMTESKEAKKPLYVRKLERELHANLQKLHWQQRELNNRNMQLAKTINRHLIKYIKRVEEVVANFQIVPHIERLKKQLLGIYVDVFNNTKMSSKTNNESRVKKYLIDLTRTLKNIEEYLKLQKECCDNLIAFVTQVELQFVEFKKQSMRNEDSIIVCAVSISQEISIIVCFQEALKVADHIKIYAHIATILKTFRLKITDINKDFSEVILRTQSALYNLSSQNSRSRKQNFLQTLIEDKKLLQMLSKKQKQFQINLFECFIGSLKQIQQLLYNQNYKKNQGIQAERNFNKIIHRIFSSYFDENQGGQRVGHQRAADAAEVLGKDQSKSSSTKYIEQFINSLAIFEEQVDWSTSYQCSLGPRMLLHGSLTMLARGLYFESYFNKRNIFFGKTRLFVPKQEIIEMNKQYALYVFSDVIEIVVKIGRLYLHTLGKQEKMFGELTEAYFPENNVQEEDNDNEMVYHPFTSPQLLSQKIEQYTKALEVEVVKEEVPNCTLARYFRRYLSDDSFVYHGKHYDNFKVFSIELIEGSNIKSIKISPGIPPYFSLKSEPVEQNDELAESERFFTYEKALPTIPFISSGGIGLCQQRLVYHWGGPYSLVLDIFNSLKGFSLTEGMEIHARQVFKQTNGNISIETTVAVTFENQSTMNGLVRSQTLSGLKTSFLKISKTIKKVERNKPSSKKNKKKNQEDAISPESQSMIQILQKENQSLKRKLNLFIALTLVFSLTTLWLLTPLLFKKND